MTAHLIRFQLDGVPVSFPVEPDMTLAAVLRQHVGCGEGVCGACTLLVDGKPVRSCLMLAMQAEDCEVATVRSLASIEGAEPDADGLTPLQGALRDHQAFQCGWCVPGLLVGTAAFLAGRTEATRAEIDDHLLGHICRCLASAGVADAIDDVLLARSVEAVL